MGKMLDFLTQEVADAESKMYTDLTAKPVKKLAPPVLRKIINKEGNSQAHFPKGFEPGSHTDWLMDFAAIEQARGTDAASIRKIYHHAALVWEPIVAAMDFKPRKYEEDVGDSPSRAKELANAYGGKVTKTGRDYSVVYTAIPQPLCSEFLESALLCAAISGDQQLAIRLAKGYRVQPGPRSGSPKYFVLRHLLAGDDRTAAEMAKLLKPGYDSDVPPKLIEFPLGLVRNDSKLLIKGLKTLNARFRGRWDEKTWRKKFEKLKSRGWRGTWEIMHRDACQFLTGMKWMTSPYALAYLNVATWRGMKSPFDKPELFSEWLPLSLCGGDM